MYVDVTLWGIMSCTLQNQATPLHAAVAKGHRDVVKTLLACNASTSPDNVNVVSILTSAGVATITII